MTVKPKANGKSRRIAVARENLVVGRKVKDVVKAAGCMASSDLFDALSRKVQALLEAAATRAKQNGRQTVRPHDL